MTLHDKAWAVWTLLLVVAGLVGFGWGRMYEQDLAEKREEG